MENKHRHRGGQRSLPYAVGMGMLLSFGMGMLLLMGVALVLYRGEDPTAHILPLSLVSLGISGLACGVLCTKLWGHASPVPSLLGGCLFAVLILAMGLCVPGSTLSLGVRLGGCPTVALLSLCGGMLSSRPKRRRVRRRS